MGLSRVVGEIKENAEKEAEAIVREAEKEAEAILSESARIVRERGKEMESEMEKEIKQIEMRNSTMRKTRKKELLLKTKRDVMEGVYGKFLEILGNAKGREKEGIYRKLLALAREQIRNPKIMYVNPKGTGTAKKVFRGVQIRKRKMKGGFILESDDRKEFVDFRFETLIELLKEKTLKNISKILFGG
jgi:vacuolar-type H+-ATPase subunit E/Vma4